MPYISPERREVLDGPIDHASRWGAPQTPGELNYVITRHIHQYLKRKGISYTALNEVTGVLECAKLELNRRVMSPYEDSKIAENGDVLP